VAESFDSIDHDLLMRAVQWHTSERWVLLYVRRWLEAPVELENGEKQVRLMGTPQGGVISPLLAKGPLINYCVNIIQSECSSSSRRGSRCDRS
jgi:retron-type reverse transcriptase